MHPPAATWTDVGIFVATSVGVVVTLLAVLVALFGPAWDRRRRRPLITVAPSGDETTANVGLQVVIPLELHNQRGRETARDVEVFVDVELPADAGTVLVATRSNLNFDDPYEEGPGRSTASIPPGFQREVNFAYFLEPNEDDPAGGHVAALSLYPARLSRAAGLEVGNIYTVKLTITGANFDAITFRGLLRVECFNEMDDVILVSWDDFGPT